MAQRTVALCEGKFIGVETIYTIVDGRQINIPEKLKELRKKSRNNELFCPCGCGSNLVLVAGDKNLREQHFRIRDGSFHQNCNVVTEGKVSMDSKIVLKCWLDDKLKAADIESRVPIYAVDDINRKYEFSFLSKSRGIAISYCHERANLSNEKLSILEGNSQGIHIIYIVDHINSSGNGQYPESLMRIQDRQGYCLFLDVDGIDYNKAKMEAVYYAQDIDGLWQELLFAKGLLKDFSFDKNGQVLCEGIPLSNKLSKAKKLFRADIERERSGRAEEQKRYADHLKRIQRQEEARREKHREQQEKAEWERKHQAEEEEKCRKAFKEKQRLKREQQEAEKRRQREDFIWNMESGFSQQETQVRDADGNRWIKCEFCGKIAMEDEFVSYGGLGRINLGTCRDCSANNPAARPKAKERSADTYMRDNPDICPECGGRLYERSGQFGKFMGCSKYPKCRYTCSTGKDGER